MTSNELRPATPTVCGISVTTRSLSPETGWCSKLLAYAGTALVAPRLQGGRNAPKTRPPSPSRSAGNRVPASTRIPSGPPEFRSLVRSSQGGCDAGELLAAVVGRARRDDRITALGQTGSRDRGDRVDRYSDLDLEIITPHRPEVFADRWPHRFGDVPPAVSFEDDEEAADRSWPAPGVAASRAVAAGAQALRPHRCRPGPAGAGCPGRSVRRCRGPARFPWHGEVVEGMRRLLAEDRTHR
ncbi:aminoglycoside 6-adenylyltransferase [Nocardia xishanensis]|uniref:Aminoglycoside 6-adenylyltransferase n=1 Tax=Nocardia xishanensis TaxID=238964 RepID=A0ABW7X557_9NOCA